MVLDKETEVNKMKEVIELVKRAIETGDYSLINKAFELASKNGIFMEEDDEYVMVEDDVFYFNGAF